MNTRAEVYNRHPPRTGSRHLTSIRGSGFSSSSRRDVFIGKFAANIPSTAGSFGERGVGESSSPPLQPELDDSPEMKLKEFEQKVY